MAAVAGEVPGRYDVVINGQGYTFLRTLDGSYLTANRHRAEYTSTPTFVARQNVSNSYGDNSQDFFLTARNRDWSLGEQQKFFRQSQDGRYWMGSNIDTSVAGQVTLAQKASAVTFAASVRACVRERSTLNHVAAGTTNLYRIDGYGAMTDLGAHGLGAAPARYGIANDGNNVYLSTTVAGTVGVRRWNGTAYSTFSATASDALVFVNNTLYGFDLVNSRLQQYDTAGVASTLFTWKDGTGAAGILNVPRLHTYGGVVLISFIYAQESSELWVYDGSGAKRLEVFPENFIASDMEVLYGVAYVAGSFVRSDVSSGNYMRPAVLFYDGSQIGKLWQANDYNTSNVADANLAIGPHPCLGISDGRLIFTDETTGNFMSYDPARGGVSSIGTFTPNAGDSCAMASNARFLLHTRNQAGAYYLPSGSYPTSGYVISSLIDFDSSLSKQFRGVKVEFAAAATGDGGSVDIAYQTESLTGSWTTLKTGAVSGTEYTFSNVSGHSIAVKVTLNKGTSTAGPTLKNMNVRAAPQLQSFEFRTFNLDLTSTPEHQTMLEDGSFQPLSGFEQAVNLRAAIQSTSPISVTDKFGTYTMVAEPDNCRILELHSGGKDPSKPGQYIATVTLRQV